MPAGDDSCFLGRPNLRQFIHLANWLDRVFGSERRPDSRPAAECIASKYAQLPPGATQIRFGLIPNPANDTAMQCIEILATRQILVRAGASKSCTSG